MAALWPGVASANAMCGYGAAAALLRGSAGVGVLGLVVLIAGVLAARKARPSAAWPWVLGFLGAGSIAAGLFFLWAGQANGVFALVGAGGLLIGMGDLAVAGKILSRRAEATTRAP